jgi:hypothetical protein
MRRHLLLQTLRRAKITSPHSSPPPIRPTLILPSPSSQPVVSSHLPTPSGCPPRSTSTREDNFNSALHSLKAFSIATALVVVGAVASLWGVKTYLGVKDVRKLAFSTCRYQPSFTCFPHTQTQEFASAMRLTLRTKWPLLTSRIHRTSDSAPLPTPVSLPLTISSPASPPLDVPPPATAAPDVDEWNWPAAKARLAAAYERGGVAQFAEVAIGELEAEAELERRDRGLGTSAESLEEEPS